MQVLRLFTVNVFLSLTFCLLGCSGSNPNGPMDGDNPLPPIASVQIGPKSPTIPLGTTQHFTATAVFTDDTMQDVTSNANWSVKDMFGGDVATVDSFGVVTAMNRGTTTVTVNYMGQVSSTVLTVNDAQLDTLVLSPLNPAAPPNKDVAFTATGTFDDGTMADLTSFAKWTASDLSGTNVASIRPGGVATAKTMGVALITASALGKSASTQFYVRTGPAPTLNSITVSPMSGKVSLGMTQRFTATGSFNDGSMQDVSTLVTWTASDLTGSGVATIAADGLATGKSVGTASINASYMGKNAIALLTVNANTTWSSMSSGTSAFLSGVWGTAANDVWIVGEAGTILRWNGTSLSSVSSGTSYQLAGIWASSKTDAWAVGDMGTVLRYNGASWVPVTSPTTQYLQGVWGSSSTNVYITGGNGTILRWNGSSFTTVGGGLTTVSLISVWGSSSSNVWAVGGNGTILRYNGSSWSTQASGTTENLARVWGTSSTDVWTVGTNGTILHYNGTSWSTVSSPTTEWIHGVFGTAANDVWGAAEQGEMVHWDGSSWTKFTTPTTLRLYRNWASAANDVWVVGEQGTILRYK